MRWFRWRTSDKANEAKEAEIQAIRQETLKHAKKAADNTDKLIKQLRVTESIFYATPAGGREIRAEREKQNDK